MSVPPHVLEAAKKKVEQWKTLSAYKRDIENIPPQLQGEEFREEALNESLLESVGNKRKRPEKEKLPTVLHTH
jgi:hypothetical protein